jgi:hypothetical protein
MTNRNELDEVKTIEEGFKKAYNQDARGTIEAIEKLRNFTLQLIHMKAVPENEIDVKALVISIGDLGRVAAETGMEIVCIAASSALGDIALEAAGQKRETLAAKTLSVVGNLALEFAGKGLGTAAKSAAESIGKFGKASPRLRVETLASLSEIYLMQIALKAMEKKISEAAIVSINFLGDVGASSAELKTEISTLEAAVILEDLGNVFVKEKSDSYANAVVLALKNLGKAASMYGLQNVLVQIVWSLEIIRVLALEQDLEATCLTAKSALESFNTIGMLDEEQNLEKIQEIKKFHSIFLKKS